MCYKIRKKELKPKEEGGTKELIYVKKIIEMLHIISPNIQQYSNRTFKMRFP